MKKPVNILVSLLLCLSLLLLLAGCTLPLFNSSTGEGVPLLSTEEITRPYAKLGKIQVTRESFGPDYSLSPDIKAWGFTAIRQEAEKMGADAVLNPEISGHTTTSGFMPSTEYRATGIAIKYK